MPMYITDCPRCGVLQTTFDLLSFSRNKYLLQRGAREVFSVCRSCSRSTVFILYPKTASVEDIFSKSNGGLDMVANQYLDISGFVSLRDLSAIKPPEHIPEDINSAFEEGATCLSVKCFNAATAMFRLCLDLATKGLLPADDVEGLKDHQRRNMSPRLRWLFESGRLPDALRDLSACIKDHGDDGAHEGSVTEVEAQDILDFTRVLLERLYTEPKRIELAKKRRDDRRNPS